MDAIDFRSDTLHVMETGSGFGGSHPGSGGWHCARFESRNLKRPNGALKRVSDFDPHI
ncbi:hypothetical protein [Streptomyces niveus]|uniref:hypothetical protein n=1 Tax=Streptomyces niveus TaxID=193462 RepID=UPI00342C3C2C